MDLTRFLNNSYTAYHTVANVTEILDGNGFVRLQLGDKFALSRGGKYYVTRNGSSVVAFSVGDSKVFNLCVCHTDSPSFRIKGDRLITSEQLSRLNTERYGGGLMYTFFDRPLRIAGRLLVRHADGLRQQLVVSPYNVVIPSLAIHHNPTANDALSVNAQTDALPLFAQDEAQLYASLCDGEVVDADLYVVPATEAFTSGVNGEFLCSPRLDNLTSVYAAINALAQAAVSDVAIVACLDNEEIGSGTRQGAPEFVREVMCAIADALGWTAAQRLAACEQGMALSVDNGHAAHPAHPEKSDPLYHARLNGGVLIKHHVNYATDALTSALLKDMLDDCKLPYQDYYNRSDVRCGSTLGLITAKVCGVKVCDIGLAQLAMHSACETCGSRDIEVMQRCLTAFLSARICCGEQGGKIQINGGK